MARGAGVAALGFALTLGAGLATLERGPSAGRVPYYACFAPGTPDSVVEWWYEQGAIKPGLAPEVGEGAGYEYFTGSSWSSTGAPTTLTWSFVPDGLFISSIGTTSRLFDRMDDLFDGDTALWISRFEASMERFETLTGLTMTRVSAAGVEWDTGSWGQSGNDTTRGDIRIAMGPIDGNNGTLAFANFPTSGDMVFDSAETWHPTSNSDRFLRNVIFHEAGHSLGIEHVCPTNGTKLMEPFINLGFVGPEHDDLRALMRQHGDPWENNNSAGQAHDFGPVSVATPISPCDIPGAAAAVPAQSSLCSIDANSEQDYYEIQVVDGDRITITVDPIGRIYADNTQAFNGSCNSGNTTDSNEEANLGLELRASNGTTILASSTGGGFGVTEEIADFAITPGTYYIRVFETSSFGGVQMYDLDVSLESDGPGTGEFNDLGFALAGTTIPSLTGTGDLTPGSATGYSTTVSNGLPFNQAFLFISLTEGNVPFKQGTLVPWPIDLQASFPLNGAGEATLPAAMDNSVPSGLKIYIQYWFADGFGPAGASASNGLELVVP